MSKKITIQQIADMSGHSKFAVSRALSGKSGVSEATRQYIVETATRLGYFNFKEAPAKKPIASEEERVGQEGPSKLKQFVIVLLPNIRMQTKDSPYWGKILAGVSSKLENKQLEMIIVTEHSTDTLRRMINLPGISGLIGIGSIPTAILLELRRLAVPIVLVDYEDLHIASDSIFVNNYDSIKKLTHYLIGLGHRKLLFAGKKGFAKSFDDRWQGFRDASVENGIAEYGPGLLELHETDFEQRREQFKAWLAERLAAGELPTAFVCVNDYFAETIMQVLQEENIAVPGTCSVTGFDNLLENRSDIPPLSTIHISKEYLGERAVEALLRRLEKMDAPFERIQLHGQILIRESTAPADQQAQ